MWDLSAVFYSLTHDIMASFGLLSGLTLTTFQSIFGLLKRAEVDEFTSDQP
jgi:hypothetical protein